MHFTLQRAEVSAYVVQGGDSAAEVAEATALAESVGISGQRFATTLGAVKLRHFASRSFSPEKSGAVLSAAENFNADDADGGGGWQLDDTDLADATLTGAVSGLATAASGGAPSGFQWS
jgi:hypothetical protein